jgi:hypothetical protein
MNSFLLKSIARGPLTPLLLAVAVLALTGPLAQAEHRATRLGHPSTRFAPPLTDPEQLRTLLTSEKLRADVASILQQAGWKGNVEDLRRAAATAEIKEVKLPKGTRLPFMSARKNGKPVALMDVLWVGEEPIDAFEFVFASNGRRYRCVTPKLCSNFLIIDLGPDLPALQLTKIAPAEAESCTPFPVKIRVRNTSTLTLTQVRVTDPLPAGLQTADHQTTLNLQAGDLAPGAGKEFSFNVIAAAAGSYVNKIQATCAEGAQAEAQAATRVHAGVLAIDCQAPAAVTMSHPAKICLVVRNTGDAPESGVILTLTVPPGAKVTDPTDSGVASDSQVVWRLPTLPPGGSQLVCAVLTLAQAGELPLIATAQGACAPAVETRCATRVAGVPGVLIEVVDVADPIPVGEEVAYEIRVTNQGAMPLTGNRMVGTVPAEQEFVSGSGVTPVHAQDRTITMEPLPVLAPNAVAKWRVVTKAIRTGDARFRVAFSSEQFPRPIDEEESTTHY